MDDPQQITPTIITPTKPVEPGAVAPEQPSPAAGSPVVPSQPARLMPTDSQAFLNSSPTGEVYTVPNPLDTEESHSNRLSKVKALLANKKLWIASAGILVVGVLIYTLALGHRPPLASMAGQANDSNSTAAQPATGSQSSNSTSGGSSTGSTSKPGTSNNNGSAGTSSGSPTPTSGSSSSGGGTTAPKTSACGNTNIPDAACTAILSIEKNGIKNNSYVMFDTSSIPSGTKASLDKSSWTSFGPEISAINGKISFLGQTYTGSLTFQLLNGTWKAISYAQDH